GHEHAVRRGRRVRPGECGRDGGGSMTAIARAATAVRPGRTAGSTRGARPRTAGRWRDAAQDWMLRLPFIVFVALLVALPLAALLVEGLHAGPVAVFRAVTAPAAWDAIVRTLWTAA